MQTRLWRRQDPKAFQATRAIECRTEPQDPRSAENAEPAMYTGKPVDVRDNKWFHRFLRPAKGRKKPRLSIYSSQDQVQCRQMRTSAWRRLECS
jgi:hypothetical protein